MSSMRAMVVDDSRAMRTLLKGLLTSNGVQVVAEAASGTQALERLRAEGTVDLVLVDWNMPEMNGYDFVRAVRAEPHWDDIRLLMVTSETEAGKMAAALEAGANEYLMKPFGKEAIRDKLQLLGLVG
jgi:two-component system chemotaxis response regulator CheY